MCNRTSSPAARRRCQDKDHRVQQQLGAVPFRVAETHLHHAAARICAGLAAAAWMAAVIVAYTAHGWVALLTLPAVAVAVLARRVADAQARATWLAIMRDNATGAYDDDAAVRAAQETVDAALRDVTPFDTAPERPADRRHA